MPLIPYTKPTIYKAPIYFTYDADIEIEFTIVKKNKYVKRLLIGVNEVSNHCLLNNTYYNVCRYFYLKYMRDTENNYIFHFTKYDASTLKNVVCDLSVDQIIQTHYVLNDIKITYSVKNYVEVMNILPKCVNPSYINPQYVDYIRQIQIDNPRILETLGKYNFKNLHSMILHNGINIANCKHFINVYELKIYLDKNVVDALYQLNKLIQIENIRLETLIINIQCCYDSIQISQLLKTVAHNKTIKSLIINDTKTNHYRILESSILDDLLKYNTTLIKLRIPRMNYNFNYTLLEKIFTNKYLNQIIISKCNHIFIPPNKLIRLLKNNNDIPYFSGVISTDPIIIDELINTHHYNDRISQIIRIIYCYNKPSPRSIFICPDDHEPHQSLNKYFINSVIYNKTLVLRSY